MSIRLTVCVRSTLSQSWPGHASLRSIAPTEFLVHDNLDRVVQRGLFTAVPSAIDSPLNGATDFRGLYTETAYSQRGLVHRQRVAIDPSQSSPAFLETHAWFDEVGRTIAS